MDKIEVGDTVSVNFHGAQMTLCPLAKVLYLPAATGDSWHFRDVSTGEIHAISEGCTVTLIAKNEDG